jgi:spore coat protein U-like protein
MGRRCLLLGAALVIAMAIAPGMASAQTVSCSISSGTVIFGNYDPLITHAIAPLDGAGNITYSCSCTGFWLLCWLFPPTVSLQIDLSTGQSLSYAVRQMARAGYPADRLAYNLYRDAARTAVWGNGTGGTQHYTTTVTVGLGGVNANLSVFGRVTGGQDIPPGSYADQIILTLTY